MMGATQEDAGFATLADANHELVIALDTLNDAKQALEKLDLAHLTSMSRCAAVRIV